MQYLIERVTVACKELGVNSPDNDLPDHTQLDRQVARHIGDCFTIVPEAIIGKPVKRRRVQLLSFTLSLCVEFTDAWSEDIYLILESIRASHLF